MDHPLIFDFFPLGGSSILCKEQAAFRRDDLILWSSWFWVSFTLGFHISANLILVSTR